jgi:hypothetical protein
MRPVALSLEVVNTLSANNDDNIKALEGALASRPNVGLVIIDHLTKYLRVGDVQDYDKMQGGKPHCLRS